MTSNNVAVLLNLMGFITGAALYAMLLAMVLRLPTTSLAPLTASRTQSVHRILLPLATAILGLFWNLCTLTASGIRDLGASDPPALLIAGSYATLGFLPAVVVHSVIRAMQGAILRRVRWLFVIVAYATSSVATAMHFHSATTSSPVPSRPALVLLTLNFSAMIVPLIVLTRREPGSRRAWWVIALSIFAISALHLSHHDGEEYSLIVELVGHHASLPLAAAILYQDFRFAFADLFLKRALTLVVLVSTAFGLYVTIGAPLLSKGEAAGYDTRAVVTVLAMWVATALAYPRLHDAVNKFVDRVILRRVDYGELRAEIARIAASCETSEALLEEVRSRLRIALTARDVFWLTSLDSERWQLRNHRNESGTAAVAALDEYKPPPEGTFFAPDARGISAAITIPTNEAPRYALVIGELSGGRRLLSDDAAMLEAVASTIARRIDGIRIMHERCEQSLREQEISKLATEAELRALRAQVNPHFLFNSLTTIGYLIRAAPDRALSTLMRLTGLLRGVLRSAGEFVTLGEEMELIESYLEIERARFEDRLKVTIDVPPRLRSLKIPPLLVQPLVENAIKHGIAPFKKGGELIVTARLEQAFSDGAPPTELLRISVRDTGMGVDEAALARGRERGLGINSIEQRLKSYYGPVACLNINSGRGKGTTAEAWLPITVSRIVTSNPAADGGSDERKVASVDRG